MPFVVIIIALVFFIWLFTRSNELQSGSSKVKKKSLPPTDVADATTAFFEDMKVIKPKKPIAIKVRKVLPVRIKASQARVIKPQTVAAVKITQSKTAHVKPPQRGAWDERGWTKTTSGNKETYEGFYRAQERKYQGRIEISSWAKRIRMYIYDPPPQIKKHEHGACFLLVKNGWFVLHWSKAARNVDDAILYMEKILDESLSKQ